jgi:hypothetical protein
MYHPDPWWRVMAAWSSRTKLRFAGAVLVLTAAGSWFIPTAVPVRGGIGECGTPWQWRTVFGPHLGASYLKHNSFARICQEDMTNQIYAAWAMVALAVVVLVMSLMWFRRNHGGGQTVRLRF